GVSELLRSLGLVMAMLMSCGQAAAQ
ncbi:MAG: hypothetical protein ACI8RN_001508, partial [Glaciecola sp.]